MKQTQFNHAVQEIAKVLNQTLNSLERHLAWEETLKYKLADLTSYLGDYEIDDLLDEDNIIQKAVDIIATDELDDASRLLDDLLERIEDNENYEGVVDTLEAIKTMLFVEDGKFDSVDSVGSTVFEALEILKTFIEADEVTETVVISDAETTLTQGDIAFLCKFTASELYNEVRKDLEGNSEVELETPLVDYLKRLFKQGEARNICYVSTTDENVAISDAAVARIISSTVMDLVHDLHDGLVNAFNLPDETPLSEYFNHYFKQ